MEAPRCFIIYSWDSEPHRVWVRKLATRLREAGIDVILDQFHIAPGADLTKFMEKSVRESSFVLLVCTPTFAQKADAGVGGVGYEKAIVTGQIFAGDTQETKFVPLLREGDAKESLPCYLKSRLFVDFRDNDSFESKLEELLRHLYGEPLYPPPPIGSRPRFGTELTSILPSEKPAPQQRITNSIGMNFVLIPAGSFTMGSPLSSKELIDRFGGEEERYEREKPHHAVVIMRPFYLQTTTVTQEQWQCVMRNNPPYFKVSWDDSPVVQVSWEDAQRFIGKLNDLEKTKAYRLPTEAEWEYGCRAGTSSEYSFGDDDSKLGEYAWYSGNSENRTHRVATRKPNTWGLFDMHGNVWEWVEDEEGYNYEGIPDDGSPYKRRFLSRFFCVMRGGSWNLGARYCRSATRGSSWSDVCYDDLGFRLARSVAASS